MSDKPTNLTYRNIGGGTAARPNVGGRFGRGQRLLHDGIQDPIADIEAASQSFEPEFLLVEQGREAGSNRLLGHLLQSDALSTTSPAQFAGDSNWQKALDNDWMETHEFVESHRNQQMSRGNRSKRQAVETNPSDTTAEDDGGDPERAGHDTAHTDTRSTLGSANEPEKQSPNEPPPPEGLRSTDSTKTNAVVFIENFKTNLPLKAGSQFFNPAGGTQKYGQLCSSLTCKLLNQD